jgi:methylated-DNA-protein-cysteine methyltransferase-like protein
LNYFAYSVSFVAHTEMPVWAARSDLLPRVAPGFSPHFLWPIQLAKERPSGYLPKMPNAFSKVYALVKRIPKGRVITYGQLARAAQLAGGARAAGRAMAATPRGQGIPWHRVVAAGGRIAIREPYASLQRRLLESEGTRFVERRVVLADHLWTIPSAGSSARPKPKKRRLRTRKPK